MIQSGITSKLQVTQGGSHRACPALRNQVPCDIEEDRAILERSGTRGEGFKFAAFTEGASEIDCKASDDL